MLSAAALIRKTIIATQVLMLVILLQDGAAFQYLTIGFSFSLARSGRHPSRLPGSSAHKLTGYIIPSLRDHIHLANVAWHSIFVLVEQA